MRLVAIAAIVLLYVLHQDFWFWRDARPLVFGFLPIGLFYHAAFTVASSLALWLLVAFAWPSDLDRAQANDVDRDVDAPTIEQ
jgi:hypothetical protein